MRKPHAKRGLYSERSEDRHSNLPHSAPVRTLTSPRHPHLWNSPLREREGYCQPISSEPASSHRPWASARARLRGRIAKLEAQLNRVELWRGPRQQQITVADRVPGARAAKGAADLVAADGFADVMHDDERGAGGFAQSQQTLAQGRHGTRVVFVLIVRGVERVENNDLGRGRAGGGVAAGLMEGNWPLTTGSTNRAMPCGFP